jgi:hypothetical protein
MLLSVFLPYGIMIIGLCYIVVVVTLLTHSLPYDLHYWKLISLFRDQS